LFITGLMLVNVSRYFHYKKQFLNIK